MTIETLLTQAGGDASGAGKEAIELLERNMLLCANNDKDQTVQRLNLLLELLEVELRDAEDERRIALEFLRDLIDRLLLSSTDLKQIVVRDENYQNFAQLVGLAVDLFERRVDGPQFAAKLNKVAEDEKQKHSVFRQGIYKFTQDWLRAYNKMPQPTTVSTDATLTEPLLRQRRASDASEMPLAPPSPTAIQTLSARSGRTGQLTLSSVLAVGEAVNPSQKLYFALQLQYMVDNYLHAVWGRKVAAAEVESKYQVFIGVPKQQQWADIAINFPHAVSAKCAHAYTVLEKLMKDFIPKITHSEQRQRQVQHIVNAIIFETVQALQGDMNCNRINEALQYVQQDIESSSFGQRWRSDLLRFCKDARSSMPRNEVLPAQQFAPFYQESRSETPPARQPGISPASPGVSSHARSTTSPKSAASARDGSPASKHVPGAESPARKEFKEKALRAFEAAVKSPMGRDGVEEILAKIIPDQFDAALAIVEKHARRAIENNSLIVFVCYLNGEWIKTVKERKLPEEQELAKKHYEDAVKCFATKENAEFYIENIIARLTRNRSGEVDRDVLFAFDILANKLLDSYLGKDDAVQYDVIQLQASAALSARQLNVALKLADLAIKPNSDWQQIHLNTLFNYFNKIYNGQREIPGNVKVFFDKYILSSVDFYFGNDASRKAFFKTLNENGNFTTWGIDVCKIWSAAITPHQVVTANDEVINKIVTKVAPRIYESAMIHSQWARVSQLPLDQQIDRINSEPKFNDTCRDEINQLRQKVRAQIQQGQLIPNQKLLDFAAVEVADKQTLARILFEKFKGRHDIAEIEQYIQANADDGLRAEYMSYSQSEQIAEAFFVHYQDLQAQPSTQVLSVAHQLPMVVSTAMSSVLPALQASYAALVDGGRLDFKQRLEAEREKLFAAVSQVKNVSDYISLQLKINALAQAYERVGVQPLVIAGEQGLFDQLSKMMNAFSPYFSSTLGEDRATPFYARYNYFYHFGTAEQKQKLQNLARQALIFAVWHESLAAGLQQSDIHVRFASHQMIGAERGFLFGLGDKSGEALKIACRLQLQNYSLTEIAQVLELELSSAALQTSRPVVQEWNTLIHAFLKTGKASHEEFVKFLLTQDQLIKAVQWLRSVESQAENPALHAMLLEKLKAIIAHQLQQTDGLQTLSQLQQQLAAVYPAIAGEMQREIEIEVARLAEIERARAQAEVERLAQEQQIEHLRAQFAGQFVAFINNVKSAIQRTSQLPQNYLKDLIELIQQAQTLPAPGGCVFSREQKDEILSLFKLNSTQKISGVYWQVMQQSLTSVKALTTADACSSENLQAVFTELQLLPDHIAEHAAVIHQTDEVGRDLLWLKQQMLMVLGRGEKATVIDAAQLPAASDVFDHHIAAHSEINLPQLLALRKYLHGVLQGELASPMRSLVGQYMRKLNSLVAIKLEADTLNTKRAELQKTFHQTEVFGSLRNASDWLQVCVANLGNTAVDVTAALCRFLVGTMQSYKPSLQQRLPEFSSAYDQSLDRCLTFSDLHEVVGEDLNRFKFQIYQLSSDTNVQPKLAQQWFLGAKFKQLAEKYAQEPVKFLLASYELISAQLDELFKLGVKQSGDYWKTMSKLRDCLLAMIQPLLNFATQGDVDDILLRLQWPQIDGVSSTRDQLTGYLASSEHLARLHMQRVSGSPQWETDAMIAIVLRYESKTLTADCADLLLPCAHYFESTELLKGMVEMVTGRSIATEAVADERDAIIRQLKDFVAQQRSAQTISPQERRMMAVMR